jgi:hypothetical protein
MGGNTRNADREKSVLPVVNNGITRRGLPSFEARINKFRRLPFLTSMSYGGRGGFA